MMKYPEAGGTQSENHTTRPTPHHTEALEKHRTVGFSAAKAVQGRSWAGRILVWPRATGGMCWLGAWRCLRWGWKVLLGLGGWDKVWERLAPPHAVLWLLLGRALAIEVPGSGPRAGAVCSKVWASEVCSSVSSCRLPGKAAAVCPPDPGNASAGPRCQARDSGGKCLVLDPS